MASMESTASQGLRRNSDDIGWEYGKFVDANKLYKVQCNKRRSNKVRNALNDVMSKTKAKQDSDESLRADMNIGNEPIDFDDCLGELKEEWEKCKFAKTVKGKFAYATEKSPSFWSGVTTCLKIFAPIAMRILPLTKSSLGCERNWSTFERKRKMRNYEVLLADYGSLAKEWVVDDVDEEIEPGLTYGMVGEASGVDEVLDFESKDEDGVEEVEVDEEDEYESDGVEIIEQYG
ncbi:hypothetical protein E3N88_12404 [Mikania micrantha]|uniref:HAT C-terminal dimerisation domain-containing protein n=1 Tax=Mikania micrantha TaxID=192012 RepID=A0A5N6P5F0_9ASTR|nr:hypothetical protein E3N88_12404 [Mikania micrantha]